MVMKFKRETEAFSGLLNSPYMEYKGLSNDLKPMDVNEGDIFQELDTNTTYMFVSGRWTFIPSYYYLPIQGGQEQETVPGETQIINDTTL